MGILRSDRVSGLGGANALNGSVFFGGNEQITGGTTTNNILITEVSSDFTFGTGDFTIEGWFYTPDLSNWNLLVGDNVYQSAGGWGLYLNTDPDVDWWKGGSSVVSGATPTANTWHHIAFSRASGTNRVFLDGALGASASDSTDYTGTQILIGANQLTTAGVSQWGFKGYVSNLRVIKGEAIYTAAFTVPTSRLEKTDNTVLLCCQSPGNVLQEATGKTLYTVNTPVASHFAPDVGEDHGTTLGDNTKFDTLSYMVPPGGTTAESNRGRGVFGGGYTSVPGDAMVKRIYYIQIDSMGTSAEFGDLSVAKYGVGGNSSSTRGLFNGGTTPTNLNTIEYITIATTSNAVDFGDLNAQHGYTASCSNQTRGLTAGGRGGSPVASVAQIDYNTIATLGNGADFGDLTQARMGLGAFESSTRGVFCGGSNSPTSPATVYNIIDYVTIATTGNATDFGDMTAGHDFHGTASSSTRGIIYGGITSYGPSVRTNIIEYVTIASTGNGTDFGDVRDDGAHAHGTSNSIRGVFAGGIDPYRNSIDFITIATTGDGVDWGDLPIETGSYAYAAGLSDSHGGIS